MPMRWRNGRVVVVCPNEHVTPEGALLVEGEPATFGKHDTFVLFETEPGKPLAVPVTVLRCGVCGYLEMYARSATSEEKNARAPTLSDPAAAMVVP